MMSRAYQIVLAKAGAAAIRFIGLVDADGQELEGGAYLRQPVTCRADGTFLRPATDLTFAVPAGAVVAGWRAFDRADGGTDFGGADLMPERFAGRGEYTLLADGTGIDHVAG